MKRIITFFAVALISLSLAGCNPEQKPDGYTQRIPYSFEGKWADPNGVISSFYNGLFETRTSDTHEKLAEGTYIISSPQMIAINMRSLVRGTISRVNCAMGNNGTHLFCTTGDGNKFSLRKTVSPA